MAGALAAQTSNIVPVGVCGEYYTNPIIGAIGANYSPTPNGVTNIPAAFATTGSKGFIAHFVSLSTQTQSVTMPYGVLFGNYLTPGVLTSPGSVNGALFAGNQPEVFAPGVSYDVRLEAEYLVKNWAISGNLAPVTPIGIKSSGKLLAPSPICKPTFVPSTALNFSQPGTYTHQFLGHVDSGPPAGATFAVTALSGGNLALSNLTYVPNDTVNPSGTFNPNSIYGDVTISGGPPGATSAELQLTANGKAIMFGMVSVSH
jgi:hypothetical protein